MLTLDVGGCGSEWVPCGGLTFEDVRHLADLGKGGAVGPGVDHVHQVRPEGVQVCLFVHVQLGLGRDLGNALGTLLTHTHTHTHIFGTNKKLYGGPAALGTGMLYM